LYFGYVAIDHTDKEKTEIFIYSTIVTSILFFISALADFNEIRGAQNDNENLCGLKGKYRIPSDIKLIYFECSYFRYYLTVFLSILCGSLLSGIAYLTQKWKQAIPKTN